MDIVSSSCNDNEERLSQVGNFCNCRPHQNQMKERDESQVGNFCSPQNNRLIFGSINAHGGDDEETRAQV